jgi:hypothetical protein
MRLGRLAAGTLATRFSSMPWDSLIVVIVVGSTVFLFLLFPPHPFLGLNIMLVGLATGLSYSLY